MIRAHKGPTGMWAPCVRLVGPEMYHCWVVWHVPLVQCMPLMLSHIGISPPSPMPYSVLITVHANGVLHVMRTQSTLWY